MDLAEALSDFNLRGARGPGDDSVCLEHITDEALQDGLRKHVTEDSCSFCDRRSTEGRPFAVPIDYLVDAVSAAIGRHYGAADDEGAPWDNEDGYMVDTYHIREVVDSICAGAFHRDFEVPLCDAIVEAVGSDIVWVDGGRLNRDALEWGWDQFTRTVRTTSRFVIAAPGSDELDVSSEPGAGRARQSDPPHQLGRFLELLLTYVDGGGDLVVELPVGTSFYRGRLMADPDSLKRTVENLRPAPPDRASANRMSPAGISLFYAAADPETAIAEIASHGPEPYAMTGTFRNTRPLAVLDLTAPAKLPSVFDEQRHTELAMVLFRNSFVEAITAPIIPDGRQHIEYTPTQVITEYLRWAPEKVIDGIALPSAQSSNGAKTYVLFFGASDCADKAEEADERDLVSLPAERWLGARDVPLLVLAKEEIQIWKVHRRYEAEKYKPWSLPLSGTSE